MSLLGRGLEGEHAFWVKRSLIWYQSEASIVHEININLHLLFAMLQYNNSLKNNTKIMYFKMLECINVFNFFMIAVTYLYYIHTVHNNIARDLTENLWNLVKRSGIKIQTFSSFPHHRLSIRQSVTAAYRWTYIGGKNTTPFSSSNSAKTSSSSSSTSSLCLLNANENFL